MTDSISAEIILRPLRVGFLVDPADRATIGEVMRLATCMWGGMMLPLIPVMKRLPRAWRPDHGRARSSAALTRGMLDFFEPDIFVSAAAGQFEAAGIAAPSTLHERERMVGLGNMIRTEGIARPVLNTGIGMDHVYEHLYSTEYRSQRINSRDVLHFAGGDRIGQAFAETAYGVFPEEGPLGELANYHRGALGAIDRVPDSAAWSTVAQGHSDVPLDHTLQGSTLRYRWDASPVIFVFDPLSGLGVIDFWNMRLVADVLPVNVH
ncbi:hypothetical protein FHS96_005553 [Sphingomonas zeicaulis]|uniref:hypothetical protein n=1 Tax=Sphingomonas zeicaulis TaxID=1632740 RepID=UPI003D1B9718